MSEPVKQTPQKRRVGDGTPGPGRPKGVPNKATVSVKSALIEAFEGMGGVPSLITWAKAEPTEFYKLYAKLLPTEIKADMSGEVTLNITLKQYRAEPQPER